MELKNVSRRVLKDALSPLTIQDIRRNPDSQVREVDAAKTQNAKQNVETRKKINDVIAAVNVTSEAATSIGKYLDSVEGILQQATDPKLEPQRQRALESEANQLLQEIKAQAIKASSSQSQRLSEDPIGSRVERELRRTLEVILPDGPGEALGVDSIRLHPPDVIIATRAIIEKAAKRIEELRASVRESSEAVRKFVQSFEVAQQNIEASQPSLRDVDSALQHAEKTRLSISKDPEQAIGSIGSPSSDVLRLLSNITESA